MDVHSVEIAAFAEVLNPAEKDRAARFVFASDRTRFILAHGTLRHLLAAYVGHPAITLRFTNGVYGKPVLAEGGPAFNISHTGAIVLIGVTSSGRHIGVDVEQHRPIQELADLVKNCFSPAELAKWQRLPPTQREAAFFRVWTRKEAFVKATGEGLARNFDSFTVSLDDAPAICTPTLPQWSLHHVDIGTRADAALAIDHPRPLVLMSRLEL